MYSMEKNSRIFRNIRNSIDYQVSNTTTPVIPHNDQYFSQEKMLKAPSSLRMRPIITSNSVQGYKKNQTNDSTYGGTPIKGNEITLSNALPAVTFRNSTQSRDTLMTGVIYDHIKHNINE